MKQIKIFAICTLTVLALSAAAIVNKSTSPKTAIKYHTANNSGFAVLELFTSEGCSSCPPAEELLARVQQEYSNKPVYVLAYHVDYWNHLGWKDAFSSPQYSKRQYRYCSLLSAQVYTPQLIINGKSECLGSDPSAVGAAINDGLNTPADAIITLHTQPNGNIDYSIVGNVDGSQLVIALVQKHVISKVEKGENAGLTLSHAQIVRSLEAFDIKPGNKGAEHIQLPNGFNPNDWELVAMIQNHQTGAISAATRASF